ncbi:MAG: hypothetical protein JW776_05655 [Candidatus Lokiarchaeota archaeon]|nr:hypothetical protein [Candidatus Lokiarchaeota archaeon]
MESNLQTKVGRGTRFLTIDVLRGISIFFMTIIHTWTNVMDLTTFHNLELSEISIFVIIIGVLLFTLGHSRSLFLFLSAIIHQFNFIKSVERGRNPENLLVKNFVKGILMYGLGLLRESFFNPWHGVFYQYPIRIWAGYDPDGLLSALIQSQWKGLYLFETLQVIGLAVIFLTIINYLFIKIRNMKPYNKNFLFYTTLTLLGFFFLFATPFVQVKLSEIVGWDITLGGYFNGFSNEKEKFMRLLWYAIAGLEEPIFPNFFCVCIGCIIGHRLTQPNTDKRIARRGCLVALGFILTGVHYWVFVEHLSFNMWFRVSPVWFLLINQGLYLLYVFLLMRLFEFRKSANLYRYAEATTFLRRWGLLALTVYMLQLLDIYPRKLFTIFTGLDFINHGRQTMLWSCILMVVAAFYFDIILRIWENSGFLIVIILLPIVPILALFPKFRKQITFKKAQEIARQNNYFLSFEWLIIFITKVLSTIFSITIAIVDVFVWIIKSRKSNKKITLEGLTVFTSRIKTAWKNVTFSRINVLKSLYDVTPYFFIEHKTHPKIGRELIEAVA